MKCVDCLRMEPPRREHMHSGLCHCPDDPSATFKTLHYERECGKFVLMNEAQREVKREYWRKILQPVQRVKEEAESES
jgi:hypothetical protein